MSVVYVSLPENFVGTARVSAANATSAGVAAEMAGAATVRVLDLPEAQADAAVAAADEGVAASAVSYVSVLNGSNPRAR